jgi:DNA-binding NtrC family response regulator
MITEQELLSCFYMNKKILIVEDQFIEANHLRLMLERAGYTVCGIARSVDAALKIITKETPGLVLLDIFLAGKQTGIDLARQLKGTGTAFIYLSANSNEEILAAAKTTEPYGFLVKPFREKDLLVTLEIAWYRHEHQQQSSSHREKILSNQLTNLITDPAGWEEKLIKIARALQPHIPFDYLAAGFNTLDTIPCHGLSFLRTGFDEYQTIGIPELLMITGLSMQQLLKVHTATGKDPEPIFYNNELFKDICRKPSFKKLFADTFQMASHLTLPIHLPNGQIFNFCFYSRRPDAYHADHIALFNYLQDEWTESMGKMLQHINVPAPLLLPETKQRSTFEGIIGKSHLLLGLFDNIMQVASSDTSVLILGESGTGKERVAECIHLLSPRKDKPLVKVNCAALPSTLIESELFGHERGAFTGAYDKRIGKFEQADQGTILLDEIGELPIELQAKLLRVLQEKEVERIGCKAPTKVNVRIIASTNRNLEKEVAEGRFRLDLYYRLNVFPLLMPPLRERKEDIPALTAHFLALYSRKTGKRVQGISEKVMHDLISYDWPGNIRELENLIERSVLLAKGAVIEDITLLPAQQKRPSVTEETRFKTIYENERDHIIAVLKNCNGRIRGAGGAAEILNVPPTTLGSKMKKLGIKRVYTE